MELSKTFQIGTDYKDQGRSLNWDSFQFAEILFVDKTHPSNRPQLYQLSDHKLTLQEIVNFHKTSSFFFSRDTFVLVGEIAGIDKKKKQVLLTNRNVICYQHLVIACGKKPILAFQDEELAAALQALTEALRVKPKIPHSFPCIKAPSGIIPPKKDSYLSSKDHSYLPEDKQNIEKIVHPYIVSQEINKPFDLDSRNSRFYEVQI